MYTTVSVTHYEYNNTLQIILTINLPLNLKFEDGHKRDGDRVRERERQGQRGRAIEKGEDRGRERDGERKRER